MASPSASDRVLASQVAAGFGVSYDALAAVIGYESGWSPTIKNPKSSARGLIQWLDSTARGLGYASSTDLVAKHPTVASQLSGPVKAYFRQYAPFRSDDEFIAAVLMPANRKSMDKPFSASVIAANGGIRNLREYVGRVWSKYRGTKFVVQSTPWVVLGLVGWWAYRTAKGKPLIPRRR